MRMSKKYEALNALADIRDYLRENSHLITGDDCYIPKLLVRAFNIVATRLGADRDWCKE